VINRKLVPLRLPKEMADWIASQADADEWWAHWAKAGAPIEGKEASVLVNFKTVWESCGSLVGANG
jgi:hypothetical protein